MDADVSPVRGRSHSWSHSPSRILFVLACSAAVVACSTSPHPKGPLSQQRELESLLQVAACPGSEMVVVLSAMQQLLAARREWDGYAYYGKLADEQPDRRALFRSLQGVMQARVAGGIGLLRRVVWVEDAIGKLDEGAAADPGVGRFVRGLVLAELLPYVGAPFVAGGYPRRAVMRRRAGCNWTPAPPRGLRSVPREAQLVG
jgi:hypothetical protein